MKRKLAALAIGAAAAPALALSVAGTAHAAAPRASSVCPTYYGCIHSKSSSSSAVTWKTKYYGTHAIYGWTGNHYVENAQTQGAYMSGLDKNKHVLWTLQDGRTGAPPRSRVANMTPVYYIRLSPGPSCWPRCV